MRRSLCYLDQSRLFDLIIANKSVKASAKGLKASPNRVGYTRYLRINEYTVALLYNRTAWMSKTSLETPFWFYFNDDEWNQSETLQSRLRTIPEFEREVIDSKIVIALRPMLDAPIDDVANSMMNQIFRIMGAKKD